MKKLALLILPLFFAQCKNDGPTEPATQAPTIVVSAVNDLREPLCVGATVSVNASLRTDENVGIEEVVVTKWGDEILSETGFHSASQNFAFDHLILPTDYALSPILLDVFLFDKNGRSARGGLLIEVTTEFAFRDTLPLEPLKYDLVENAPTDAPFDLDADLEFRLEILDCGPDCSEYAFSVKSATNTRFFNVPKNEVTTPDNLALKQFDLFTIVSTVSPSAEIEILRRKVDDNGQVIQIVGDNFPIVAKLRDTEEYAVFDFEEENERVIYAKRSAGAGGE